MQASYTHDSQVFVGLDRPANAGEWRRSVPDHGAIFQEPVPCTGHEFGEFCEALALVPFAPGEGGLTGRRYAVEEVNGQREITYRLPKGGERVLAWYKGTWGSGTEYVSYKAAREWCGLDGPDGGKRFIMDVTPVYGEPPTLYQDPNNPDALTDKPPMPWDGKQKVMAGSEPRVHTATTQPGPTANEPPAKTQLRRDNTPEANRIWAGVDAAAAKAPTCPVPKKAIMQTSYTHNNQCFVGKGRPALKGEWRHGWRGGICTEVVACDGHESDDGFDYCEALAPVPHPPGVGELTGWRYKITKEHEIELRLAAFDEHYLTDGGHIGQASWNANWLSGREYFIMERDDVTPIYGEPLTLYQDRSNPDVLTDKPPRCTCERREGLHSPHCLLYDWRDKPPTVPPCPKEPVVTEASEPCIRTTTTQPGPIVRFGLGPVGEQRSRAQLRRDNTPEAKRLQQDTENAEAMRLFHDDMNGPVADDSPLSEPAIMSRDPRTVNFKGQLQALTDAVTVYKRILFQRCGQRVMDKATEKLNVAHAAAEAALNPTQPAEWAWCCPVCYYNEWEVKNGVRRCLTCNSADGPFSQTKQPAFIPAFTLAVKPTIPPPDAQSGRRRADWLSHTVKRRGLRIPFTALFEGRSGNDRRLLQNAETREHPNWDTDEVTKHRMRMAYQRGAADLRKEQGTAKKEEQPCK